jgi:hypothetical protein
VNVGRVVYCAWFISRFLFPQAAKWIGSEASTLEPIAFQWDEAAEEWKDVARYIQIPSATNFVNRFTEIAVAVPWESGKRSLFSIFSMAFYQPSHGLS